MFKRRNPLSYWQWFKEGVYPKSGWKRVINYIGFRLKRLPDTPHRISLGFALGAFVSFSPLFGLHFFYAMFLAYIFRGNMLSSLIGTFFGNPVTFPIIAAVSYNLGLSLLGMRAQDSAWHKVKDGVLSAFSTIWNNLKSAFGYGPTRWDGFVEFFNSILVPYFVGGLIPGAIVGIGVYFASKPLVKAYQTRRRGKLMAKFNELRDKNTQKNLGK